MAHIRLRWLSALALAACTTQSEPDVIPTGTEVVREEPAPVFESAPVVGRQATMDVGGFIPSVYFDGDPDSPCSPNRQLGDGPQSEEAGFTCLELFFATNRDVAEDVPADLRDYRAYPADPDQFFADYRLPVTRPEVVFARQPMAGETQPEYETYLTGRAFVTVPRRQPGEKVVPFDYKGFFGGENLPNDRDRRRYFSFAKYELLKTNEFWSLAANMKELSEAEADYIETWADDAGAALIFVHGFNTGFAGAAYRTAQLAYDLEFAGVPFFFSWPANSAGDVLKYFNDVSEGVASTGDLKLFLRDVKERLNPTKTIIIAHSHGNQVLLNALNEMLGDDPNAEELFDLVIFASPDVDAVEFKRVAERVSPLARDMTLYTSRNDRANIFRTVLTRFNIPFLADSEPKPRAGYIPPDGPPVFAAGVDTIDVTSACVGPYGSDLTKADAGDRLKHARYADSFDLVADMREAIDRAKETPVPAPQIRNSAMAPKPAASNPRWWEFVPPQGRPSCD